MKKFKYQQYSRRFIVFILSPYEFWFRFQQNIATILISAVFRGVRSLEERRLFQCGYLKYDVYQRCCTQILKFEFFLFRSEGSSRLLTCHKKIFTLRHCRDVFKTQPNIYDGAFLPKQLTLFCRQLFSQNNSIVDVRLGSKCKSALYLLTTLQAPVLAANWQSQYFF